MPWPALAAFAVKWWKTACFSDIESEDAPLLDIDRYTFTVAWNHTTRTFVATVAEFPGLESIGMKTRCRLCGACSSRCTTRSGAAR